MLQGGHPPSRRLLSFPGRLVPLLPSALPLLLLDRTPARIHDRQDEADRATDNPGCEDAKVLPEAAFGAEEDSLAVLQWSRAGPSVFTPHTSTR